MEITKGYIVAVRIKKKNKLFVFKTKKDMNGFIKDLKKTNVEYMFTPKKVDV